MDRKQSQLDVILTQLGDFGTYQILQVALISLPLILVSAMHLSFVFSAMDIKHRCKIPECDLRINPEFKPEWLRNAVPFEQDQPNSCHRYQYYLNGSLSEKFPVNENVSKSCRTDNFDRSKGESCDKFVYESPEVTITHDFNLQCDHNLWKLTMIGTINNIGQFVGKPLSGFVSDRYGRKTMLVWGTVLSAASGIVRALVPTYTLFLIFEFLDASFGCGIYGAGFILGIELVGPQKRVLTGTIISSYYTVAEILIALLAWLTMSWRPMLLILYIPSLLLIGYFWILPESVRWLLTQRRNKEAIEILRKAARFNKKPISQEYLDYLAFSENGKSVEETQSEGEQPIAGRQCSEGNLAKEEISNYPIKELFKSKTMIFRLVISGICWMTCSFLFYGLTWNSVTLAGNHYIHFALTSLVEIPAYLATYFLIDRIGRRYSLCLAFLLSSLACIAFICVKAEAIQLRLALYLVGKFGATLAYTVNYFFTNEIFPTSLRQSTMAWCSTMGRIGSMAAPQIPLLAKVWPLLPLVLYAVMGGIAGILTLLLPETLKRKLPDSVEEAVELSNIKNNRN